MRSARLRSVIVLLVAAVSVGTAAATPGPRAEHTSAGTKLAQSALLRVGDFGSGWTTDAAAGQAAGLNFSCTGFGPKQDDFVEIGTAQSPQFRASQIGPFVVQRTSVYESAKAVRTLWQRSMKPGIADCVAQSLEALRSKGVGVSITARDTIALGQIGDRTAGYRIVATLTTRQRLKTYYDMIWVGGGRAITQLTVSQFQKPPPLKWEIALAKAAARRLGIAGPAA
jgi:hypothetical protein